MADQRPVRVHWELETTASRQATWALFSDTDRLNRPADPGCSYVDMPQPDGTLKRPGSITRLGVTVEVTPRSALFRPVVALQAAWQDDLDRRRPLWPAMAATALLCSVAGARHHDDGTWLHPATEVLGAVLVGLLGLGVRGQVLARRLPAAS